MPSTVYILYNNLWSLALTTVNRRHADGIEKYELVKFDG